MAGVSALWAFLSFILKMDGGAVHQAPSGYVSSPGGICLTHDLLLALFVCLLFWELPDMVLVFEVMAFTCGMFRTHESPSHRDARGFRRVQGW